jgi:hypothetical protein
MHGFIPKFQKISNLKRGRRTMDENGKRGIMVMMMLLVTLFLVLKHVEDRPLPFFAPQMPPSPLHPFSLRVRLLFFSTVDGGEHRLKKVGGKHREMTKLSRLLKRIDKLLWKPSV